MTSTPTARAHAALRHVSDQITASAALLDAASDTQTCHHATAAYRGCAIEFRRLARILMGDLGEEQEEVEVVPLHNPAEVPTTAPREPVPA
jgi:hypothetical protein